VFKWFFGFDKSKNKEKDWWKFKNDSRISRERRKLSLKRSKVYWSPHGD
jgi:hypothetical protein